MRGANRPLTRLYAAGFGIATAAFLALNAAPVAAWAGPPTPGAVPETPSLAEPDDAQGGSAVAYAVPRDAPGPDVEVMLPQPLAPSAVALYGRINDLQNQGRYAAADALIGRLDDTTLIGPILANRYLGDGYRSSVAELQGWLAKYGGEPQAAAVYALLRAKSPDAGGAPPAAALLPETTLTPSAAARPATAPGNPRWFRVFQAGIAAWKTQDLAAAQADFAAAASLDGIAEDDHAAAAFWSARAALRLQHPRDYLSWLQQAAADNQTFYGILAGRLLGENPGPGGVATTLTEADVIAVDASANGHLAFALLQVGDRAAAATALRALWPQMRNDAGLAHAAMAVAARAGLVDVAVAIAGQTPANDNSIAEALPLPALHPDGGFTIDPPLIYALTRTESGFDAQAVSPAGARGLMQLMPQTARFVARDQGLAGAVGNPSANLALGQGYLRYLGEQPGIDDNLLAILASYNAGPGAAAGWYSALRQDSDPLLFIETIPNAATRRFVRQVMADSWIYAEEIGLKPRSLDDLAQGNFPQLSGEGAVTASR